MTRRELFDIAREQWGVEADCPFAGYPEVAVLRHADSRKWFAIVMPVRPDRLGLRDARAEVDVLNLKCQPPLVTMLLEREGVFPAYHMDRRHWVSIVLDGPFPDGEIVELLALSRRLTAKGRKKAAC